jgi:hypothetical protein
LANVDEIDYQNELQEKQSPCPLLFERARRPKREDSLQKTAEAHCLHSWQYRSPTTVKFQNSQNSSSTSTKGFTLLVGNPQSQKTALTLRLISVQLVLRVYLRLEMIPREGRLLQHPEDALLPFLHDDPFLEQF